MTWKQIQHEINLLRRVFRAEWDECKYVRKAVEADVEYINYPVENIIVEDCTKRECDCKVVIYQPTEEDMKANDWYVMKT